MAYITDIMQGAGSGSSKKVKPEKASLYDTRLQIDPATNPDRVATMAPWWNAVNTAAGSAAARVGADDDSGLLKKLQADASTQLDRGGDLDPWEEREATQGARAGWQARGLVNSVPASFSEVLARVQYAEARRKARTDYATGIAGLGLQNRQQNAADLSALTSASVAPSGLAESERQFDLERDDTLKFNDKSIAKDLKVGQQNAQAGAAAGRSSMFGSILGGIFSAL